jgi:hypothetical protein
MVTLLALLFALVTVASRITLPPFTIFGMLIQVVEVLTGHMLDELVSTTSIADDAI